MKKLLFLLIQAFSAQAQVLPELPPYFDYALRTDSMLILESDRDHYFLKAQGRDFNIGCRGAFAVEIAFSLSMDNDFLFDDYPKFMAEEYHEEVPVGFEFILYGIKKQSDTFNASFRDRINDYCIYGQHNYYFESQDYFIFTYQFAMNGGGTVKQYEKYGLWQEFKQSFSAWLDEGNLQEFRLEALSEQSLIGTDFDWEGEYLMYPRDSVQALVSLGKLAQVKTRQAHSPRRLELKSRNRARSTSNYNQPRDNWFVDKAKWWRHQNLIYVWVEGWGLQVYRIEAPGILLNLEHNFAFLKQ